MAIDVVARGVGGTPVLILLCGPDLAQAIGRCAGVLAAWHQGRFLLDRLYGEAGLVAEQTPRFRLISRRFSATRPGDLLQLVGGCDVVLFESQVVQAVDGRPELHLVPMARSGSAPAAEAQPTARAQPTVAAPARTTPPSSATSTPPPTPTPPRAEPRVAPAQAAPTHPSLPAGDELINPLIGAGAAPAAPVRPESAALTEPPVRIDPPVASPSTTQSGPPAPAGPSAPAEVSQAAPATNPGFPMAVAPSQANGGDERPLPAIDDIDLLVRAEASPECRRLCLAARDSIRSLSSLVSQTIEPDRLCFLVDGVLLATLIPRGDSLQLRVGEEGGPAFEVHDDESFNASLNATFSHYFSRFAVRA